jgi:uncharacterized protein YbjT (DUF2867 family)
MVMRIIVMGATGNVGSELVSLLSSAGHEVAAATRTGQLAAGLTDGVTAFAADLAHGDTLRDAVAGVDGAFMLAGYDDAGLIAELERAGAARVALLSSGAVGTAGPDNAVAAYHRASERALRESSLGWTFVRPSTFMSNALRWADAIRAAEPVVAPFADVPIATNDPRDVAAVLAVALTTGAHDGQVYRVSGPQALRPDEQVEILAEILEREIGFEAQSNEAARTEMDSAMPTAYVDAFFELFVEGHHDESAVLPTVKQVTGSEPRSFRDWAVEHAPAFR